MRRFAYLGLMAAAAAMAPVGPGHAQQFSEGHEFLKAVKNGDGAAATAALEKPGATIVNARDLTSGQGALHLVTQRRDTTWLRFLLAKGANPNLADRAGITPLQLATNLGWVEGVEALVAKGASVELSNGAGETPLISAIHRRDPALVRALLKAGADPDKTDNSGRSARDYAARMGAQGPMMAELNKAQADRKARSAKTYGPGA